MKRRKIFPLSRAKTLAPLRDKATDNDTNKALLQNDF